MLRFFKDPYLSTGLSGKSEFAAFKIPISKTLTRQGSQNKWVISLYRISFALTLPSSRPPWYCCKWGSPGILPAGCPGQLHRLCPRHTWSQHSCRGLKKSTNQRTIRHTDSWHQRKLLNAEVWCNCRPSPGYCCSCCIYSRFLSDLLTSIEVVLLNCAHSSETIVYLL